MAYLHSEQVSHSFMDSVFRVMTHEADRGQPLHARWPIRTGPNTIPEARNQAMAWFLGSREEWLWMVDTDMGFREDTLEQLLKHADPEKAPVVSALCFAHFHGQSDQMGGYYTQAVPTLYTYEKLPDGEMYYTLEYAKALEFPKNELVPVMATGAACILIHRSVGLRLGKDWFTPKYPTGAPRRLGEDISFCDKLREKNIPVHVHTGIPTTHHKYVYLGGAE